jgi:hypothetical protein
MTSPVTEHAPADIRARLRSEGIDVPDRGRLSAEHLAQYEALLSGPLPGPDDDIDLDAMFGELPPGPPGPPVVDDGGPLAPDEPPAPIPPGPERKGRTGAAKVTATVRKDIYAKISLGLELPGRVWAARDPYCGGAFVVQRPAIADALADIVCDSADLVAWFTGPAGGFMKYLKLAAALQPVAVTVYGHHIAHAIGAENGQAEGQPDLSRYVA